MPQVFNHRQDIQAHRDGLRTTAKPLHIVDRANIWKRQRRGVSANVS